MGYESVSRTQPAPNTTRDEMTGDITQGISEGVKIVTTMNYKFGCVRLCRNAVPDEEKSLYLDEVMDSCWCEDWTHGETG